MCFNIEKRFTEKSVRPLLSKSVSSYKVPDFRGVCSSKYDFLIFLVLFPKKRKTCLLINGPAFLPPVKFLDFRNSLFPSSFFQEKEDNTEGKKSYFENNGP